MGSEDLNDHEEVRNDALLAVLVGKADPSSQALAEVRHQHCDFDVVFSFFFGSVLFSTTSD
jgi:hypothetical protein